MGRRGLTCGNQVGKRWGNGGERWGEVGEPPRGPSSHLTALRGAQTAAPDTAEGVYACIPGKSTFERQDTPMQNQRVRYLLDEGEPLTIPRHVIPQVLRLGVGARTLGLPEEALISTPAVSVPFPRYVDDKPLRGTPGVRPAALRYPFMWLPAGLRERYELADETGGTKLESDSIWALRVALEMFTSGAFNANTGGWIDILALYDLDVSDPATAERIQRWWDGEDDELLDAIDISEMFEVDIPEDGSEPETDWAIISASSIDTSFRNAAYCFAGFDISALSEMIKSGNTGPFGNANTKDSIRTLINVAMSEFVDEPDIFTAFGRVRERSLFRYESDDRMIREVLSEVDELADAVASAYLPYLDGVMESDIVKDFEREETERRDAARARRAERAERAELEGRRGLSR